ERAREQARGAMRAHAAREAAVRRRRRHLAAGRRDRDPRSLRRRGLRPTIGPRGHAGTGNENHRRSPARDGGLGARNRRRARSPGPRRRGRPRHDGRVRGLPV
ncbi:MAG: hypothetical protein AVDCRST_MAG25-3561, partial [uncultured Rubrobacteraceae bacterium]